MDFYGKVKMYYTGKKRFLNIFLEPTEIRAEETTALYFDWKSRFMRKVSPDIEGCCTHPHLPLNYARVQDQVIGYIWYNWT